MHHVIIRSKLMPSAQHHETWLRGLQEAICSQGSEHLPWSECDVFFFSYRSFRDDITESCSGTPEVHWSHFPRPPLGLFQIKKHVPGRREFRTVGNMGFLRRGHI